MVPIRRAVLPGGAKKGYIEGARCYQMVRVSIMLARLPLRRAVLPDGALDKSCQQGQGVARRCEERVPLRRAVLPDDAPGRSCRRRRPGRKRPRRASAGPRGPRGPIRRDLCQLDTGPPAPSGLSVGRQCVDKMIIISNNYSFIYC